MPFPNQITDTAYLSQGGISNNYGSTGPFGNGVTDRYMILLMPDVAVPELQAWKSADNGITWAKVDGGNSPLIKANDARLWDYYSVTRNQDPLVHVLYTVYWAADGTLRLIPFDMDTATWGAPIASALVPPEPEQVPFGTDLTGFGIAHRSTDNSVWIAVQGGTNIIGPVFNSVYGAKCVIGGAWDAAFTLLGSITSYTEQVVGMVVDSLGNAHLIMSVVYNNIGLAPPNALVHRVIHFDDTLSIPDGITPYNGGVVTVSYPTISSVDEILFTLHTMDDGLFGYFTGAIRGIAGDAPVWDTFVLDALVSSYFPLFLTTQFDGLDYLFYIVVDANPNIFHYSYATSAGIGFPFVFVGVMGDTDNTVLPQILSITGAGVVTQSAGNIWAITTNFNSIAVFPPGQAYYEAFAAPPTVPPQMVGGGKTPRKCGNWWDECLQDTTDFFKVLDWSQIVSRVPRCYIVPEPNCDIPLSGQQFRRQGALNLPPDDGLDYQLLQYDVPDGYIAVVTDHVQMYSTTMPGYEEASNDLLWRMRVDQWYVKDMGKMNTTRGDLSYLFPIPQFLLLNEGQTLRYYINVAVGSAVRFTGGKIIVSVHGWFYSIEDIRKGRIEYDQRMLKRYYRTNRAIERTKHILNGGK